MNKKILLTGGSGFIGVHLTKRLLESGYLLVNVDNFDDFYSHEIKLRATAYAIDYHQNIAFSGDKKTDVQHFHQLIRELSNYKIYFEDICNAEAIHQIFQSEQPDIVIHLAALAGVRPSLQRPNDYTKVNVWGSQVIMEACKKNKIKKCIFASSSSVYGQQPKTPFEETDTVDFPISPYASTKKAMEVISHPYHHLYGIDFIHLRFFTVYGPWQRPDLAIHSFAKRIIAGQPIPFFGDGTTRRDYTYIDDIIHGIEGAISYIADNQSVFEIINLGESETISLTEMVRSLEDALGKRAIIEQLPMQPGDVPLTFASIEKAKKLLGYQPKVKFNEGIQRFADWFLKQQLANEVTR